MVLTPSKLGSVLAGLLPLLTLALLLRTTSALSMRGSGIASRSKFLSSTAATFLVSSGVLAVDPESHSCTAAAAGMTESTPRYIDRELEMKYGEDSSEYN